jgi:benzodiazapine receptor
MPSMSDTQRRAAIAGRENAPPGVRHAAGDDANRERWWLWPVISLIGYLAVLATNYLANSLPFNDQSTGDVTEAYFVPFQPAGWVFGTIWPTIYLLLGIYVVYSFLPAGRRHSLIDSVGPILLLANVANITWLFVWHWERLVLALIVLLILAASLAAIYFRIRNADRDAIAMSPLQQILLTVPFTIYFGWTSIASFANVQILMSEGGWDGTLFSLEGWTVVFLFIGIALAALVSLRWEDAVFPLVFAYAYTGIASRQWNEDNNIGIIAAVLAAVAVALAIVALVRSIRGSSGDARETPVVGSYGE